VPCPAGPDGELREAIERLERDLVVQRNRAEVNALFKEEHDRWGWGGVEGGAGCWFWQALELLLMMHVCCHCWVCTGCPHSPAL
jgi:hypothetical protein